MAGKYSVQISRFDGGLNTKANILLGRADQSPDSKNIDYDDEGAVKTRNGYGLLNTTAIGTAAIDGLHSYAKSTGTKQLLAGCKGSVWFLSGTTFSTIPSSQSQYTVGNQVNFMNYQNYAWICNGEAQNYKYDGTNFTQWGVSAPSAATVAVNSAGNPSGQYRYVVGGVNSASVAGNYGSATTEVSLTAERGYLTEIPVFPTSAGVNTKNIYRNTAGASGLYYLLTNIANATTVYEDNTADDDLGAAAATDAYEPPVKFKFTLNYLGYTWGFADNSTSLYYSLVNEPEQWPAANLIKVGQDDGLPIKGLAILGSGLVISKHDGKDNGSLYYLYIPDGTIDSISLVKLDTQQAGLATRVMLNFSNLLMYLNNDGVFDLTDTAIGSIKADSLSFDIEDDIFALLNTLVQNAVAVNWKNKVWLSVPYAATATENNRIYVYDYVKGRGQTERTQGAWSYYDSPQIADFTIHDGTLYGGSALADGKVYQLDTGTSDNSSAIDSYYKTFAIRGAKEHENNVKIWRYCYIMVEAYGNFNMDFTYYTDFYSSDSGTIKQIDLTGGSQGEWGSSIWGSSTWGAGLEKKIVRIDFVNAVGKSIQLKFSTNTADQRFKVYDVKLEYTLRSKRGSES